MFSNLFANNRLRLVFAAIILATLPCYCLGLIAVAVAPEQNVMPTFTPTLTLVATSTLPPTLTAIPTFPKIHLP